MVLSGKSGAAKLALGVVIGLIVLKAVVAAITGSLSITAQAVDSFLDLFAVVITLFAINVAERPADKEHPFGHGKVEGIAAVAQAVLILIAAGLIIYSAIRRIITGSAVELTEAGIGVMLVSIVVSILLSRHLFRVARTTESIALEAAARNIAADVYSAAGVLVGLVVIRFTGLTVFDPVIAMLVSLFILRAAYDVLRKSFGELVDVRLPTDEEAEIISCLEKYQDRLASFHEVRTRRAGSQRFIDLHLMLPKDTSVEEAHQMCDNLEQDIGNRLPNSNVTIHVEPCSTECDRCQVASCNLRINLKLD